jgi:hypothetical protein
MIIFEPPQSLGGSGLPIWLGISGGPNWGGADIWVSEDNATYQNIGRVTQAARWGKLSAALPAGSAIDQTDTLAVDLTQSSGTLASAGTNGAQALTTLAYVGGELLAYGTATLTGVSKYNLTYLVRGAYGTAIAAHPAGAPFLRLDSAIFEYTTTPAMIGQTLYIKFVSFNVFGNYGTQSLSTVQPVTYTVTGKGLNTPPAAITNLASTLGPQGAVLQWTGVTDTRPLDYEIRSGASWAQGLFIGRSSAASYPVSSTGTYWVAARAQPVAGFSVYQATPISATVAQSSLTRTILYNSDQGAASFPGTTAGALVKVFNASHQYSLVLGGTANMLAEANYFTIDALYDGGVGSGTYTLPSAINLGTLATAQVTINVQANAASIYTNMLGIGNFLTVTDFLGNNVGIAATIQPQLLTAGTNAVYGSWTNFTQGQVSAQYIQVRLSLQTSDPQVMMQLTGLTVTIDVQPLAQSGVAVAIPSAGTTVTFPNPYVNTPSLHTTIIGGSPGDNVIVSAQSATGFTAQVANSSGSPVARSIDWYSYGF